tara:strand:- start:93011 stop:93421 length:411 start_codon:yes stop_codon:yes gene_type:complete
LPKWVRFNSPLKKLRIPEQLGYEVEICGPLEEPHNFSERGVLVDLFEKCLGEPYRVRHVLTVRPFKNNLSILPDCFLRDDWLPISPGFLPDNQAIAPNGRSICLFSQAYINRDFGVTSCRKRAKFRKAAAILHSLL